MKNLKDQLAGIAALIAAIIKHGEITTRLDVLTNASKSVDIDYSAQIAVIEEKVAALSEKHGHTKMLVNAAEIKLLKVQIEEIKVSTSNPLAN